MIVFTNPSSVISPNVRDKHKHHHTNIRSSEIYGHVFIARTRFSPISPSHQIHLQEKNLLCIYYLPTF